MKRITADYLRLLFCCLTLCCVLVGCGFSPHGYHSIEGLYIGAQDALRAQDSAQIDRFVRCLLPDAPTGRYMERYNCSYRGFPAGVKFYPDSPQQMQRRVVDLMCSIARDLEAEYGSLQDLTFVGFDPAYLPNPEPMNTRGCSCREILYAEPWGLYTVGPQRDTISLKLGELLCVKGVWKSFTLMRIH